MNDIQHAHAVVEHGAARGFRPEIQGLRAVAVLAVLAYHLWPAALPGGYVGVDVFFVISGYLITSLLLAEAEAYGKISIARFYTRRIKRLLPAATCVLLAAAAMTVLLPPERREEASVEIAASALYVQNYWLAQQARDYLALDEAPSLLQHYWSLSVEEQYYIVWPLVLALLGLVPGLRARPRATFFGIASAALLGSLAYSVYLTAENAGHAYFATTTRAWELAIGGLLSLLPRRAWPRAAGTAAGLAGLACIAAACTLYSQRTPFPGYAALLPTLGAALLIAAPSGAGRVSSDTLLCSAPMQYLGGISYSLYLWHWPLVVVHEAQQGGEPSLLGSAGVLLASIALAHLTKRFVEDPCRAPRFAGSSAYLPFAFASGCIAASLGVAFAIYRVDRADEVEAALPLGGERPGARALEDAAYDFKRETTEGIAPRPKRALKDLASSYRERCMQKVPGETVTTCDYGSDKPELHIVLIGDSHAAHWFPAFQELAAQRPKLRFTGIAKSACAFSLDPVYYDRLGRPYTECLAWSRGIVSWLAEHRPDLVIASQSPKHRMSAGDGDESAAVARGLAKAWSAVTASGLRMLAITSTPWWPIRPSECVSTSQDWQRECVVERGRAFLPDPVTLAARATKTPLLDMNDAFCRDGRCFPIIGNVLVYRDTHHITATYSRTLARRLEQSLKQNGIRLPR